MFSSVLQPSSISIFSSTGSEPLQLWGVKIDSSSGSCIDLLHDGTSKLPYSKPSTSLVSPPPLVELGGAERDPESDSGDLGYDLDQTVLHIQSPRLPSTYIQCPPDKVPALGLRHPWMHLHVRNMGREWGFEVGLVDHAGRTGILRMSTFQKQPSLKLSRGERSTFPLLHLPLSFPSRSSRPLTAWTTINVHLPTFIPYFSHSNLLTVDRQGGQESHASQSWDTITLPAVPSGSYSHVSFVRVYATCRLRRIWFDEHGPDQTVPWEFELYSAD
ncbi:hypothetical protein P691DRAFT_667793 [Macrolepiota fuliginosa MF-IS2]|uniref:CFA20 domain-containing protein n=1 Tax=Macrolepiota fuliginosa MF-IS2 TaxID=1400762 RepID=A0A9P5XDB6_9AGAR|nr:hypothetical protein P691DRAFT_667793 [Macrolepiota fuliginosa MF-IS2]